jgi:hypothetical protein
MLFKPATPAANSPDAKIIELAGRAADVLDITELEPDNGAFAGKSINFNRKVSQYPRVTWWRQSVAQVPATIPHLFAYLRAARMRNIVLIRGAPASAPANAGRSWHPTLVIAPSSAASPLSTSLYGSRLGNRRRLACGAGSK